MFGAHEYCKQNYPGHRFSKIYYENAIADNAGFFVAIRDWNKQGARAILIHSLVISFAATAPAVVTFTDNFNIPIFTMDQNVSAIGIYNFFYLIDSSIMSIKSNSAAVKFSVGYQYVSPPQTGSL